MEQKRAKNFGVQFTLIGFFSGLVIIGVIFSLALKNHDLLFSFSNIAELHKTSLEYFFTDTIPLILALVGFLTGLKFTEYSRSIYELQKNKNKISEDMLNFAEDLAKGELGSNYSPPNENKLGGILVNLRDNLYKNQKEDKKRKNEDQQRSWVSEGLAKFGDILRQDNDNIELLSLKLISNLCNYIGAVQGGFFVIDEENNNKYLDLIAHFAYGRNKYNKKKIGAI